MAEPRWFTLRFGAFSKVMLELLASGPGSSGIAVDNANVAFAMGRSFGGRAPRGSITHVAPCGGSVLSRGVHGWRGEWLVNGAGDGLVEVRFDPAMKARVLGFPVHVRRLRIAVDDPAGLVAAIGPDVGV